MVGKNVVRAQKLDEDYIVKMEGVLALYEKWMSSARSVPTHPNGKP